MGTQLHEDAHRFQRNVAGVMATLSSASSNMLSLAGFRSIWAGLQAILYNITPLLAMAQGRPEPTHI